MEPAVGEAENPVSKCPVLRGGQVPAFDAQIVVLASNHFQPGICGLENRVFRQRISEG